MHFRMEYLLKATVSNRAGKPLKVSTFPQEMSYMLSLWLAKSSWDVRCIDSLKVPWQENFTLCPLPAEPPLWGCGASALPAARCPLPMRCCLGSGKRAAPRRCCLGTSENLTQSFENHNIDWRCTQLLAVIIYIIGYSYLCII